MDARDKILDAALRVFAECGSRGATTRRIAEAAGVNEVTLFRQFGTKQRLLRAALERRALHIPHSTLPMEPRDPAAELRHWAASHLEHLHATRALIRTSMGEFEEHPDVSCAACEGPMRVAHELTAYLERLRERGMISADCDTQAACALLMGAVFADAMGRDIMPERYPFSRAEAAERYIRLFLRGIGAEPAGAPLEVPTGEPRK